MLRFVLVHPSEQAYKDSRILIGAAHERIPMPTARAFASNSKTSPLALASIPRREVGATDVEFDILFCGVCHSDLHMVRDEWDVWPTIYPCVPGHEIVGRVTKVGANVKSCKPGDLAAVGCMVDSCGTCGS